MTAATVAVLAAQIDPFDVDFSEQWPWSDGANPDLWLYRERTIALLKRYMRFDFGTRCNRSFRFRSLFLLGRSRSLCSRG